MTSYGSWVQRGLNNEPISADDAEAILRSPQVELLPLLDAAGQVRRHFFGNRVTVHVLDNVQNGACPEDCGYCGQSKNSDAPIKPYKLKSVDEIVAEAQAAKDAGAWRFCMVLSGRGPDDADISHMTEAVRRVKAMGLRTCLSAGLMDIDKAQQLKSAGLDRLNHNLNTSRENYPNICTTHTYDDRMNTLAAARQAGIGLCSGLIAGLGESFRDLVEVAFQLRAVQAESIPVNFLLPIEGNPLTQSRCEGEPLNPQLVLRILCMMRLVNPNAEVRVAAGREHHLRSMQSFALWPANSLFMDGYLLTEGSGALATLRMILDAGFTVASDEGNTRLAELLAQVQHGAADEITVSSTPALKPAVTGQRRNSFVPAGELRVSARNA
jgi:biotin synthase